MDFDAEDGEELDAALVGDQETIQYVVEGIARYRWGERLEHVVEAGPGDFVFIPAQTVHQEINASADSPTAWAVTRSGTDPEPPGVGQVRRASRPRPQTRYLIEFLCSGDSINIQSSDGVALQANGPSSVVYHSTNASVTYSTSSPGLWHFFGCTISWLSA